MTRDEDFAPDVIDLVQAKRLIAALRRELRQLTGEPEPEPRWFFVGLEPGDAALLYELFEAKRVCLAQRDHPEMLFHDAFAEFFSESLELASDLELAPSPTRWHRTERPPMA